MLSFRRSASSVGNPRKAGDGQAPRGAGQFLTDLVVRTAPLALLVIGSIIGLTIGAAVAAAQPALTTVQDILYRADGTRYNGTMFIAWSSFLAGDASNIATANLTVPVVNGVLSVQLVPTTTGSAGAQYNVTYNSNGVNQFTEVWAVPPSSVALRISAIRVSTGTVVGPVPVSPLADTAVAIGDVTGLENELAIRPLEGVGFTVGRTAIIDASGQIDGAAGNLSDCMRVDGTSGACGSSSSGGLLPSFADGEIPAGSINGANTVFSLVNSPSPVGSLDLYLNGLLMNQGGDYTLSNNIVTFVTASTPQSGDTLLASYRFANPNNPLGSLTAAQVICSSTGSGASSTSLIQLGSCTIPAGLIESGDRVEIQFQYAHTGTTMGFTGEVLWGGTQLFSRTAAASETVVAGKMAVGIYSGGQTWDGLSWGSSLSFAAAVGTAAENTGANLTISLQSAMAGATSDVVTLRNFTVVRYPAQSNP
jgi:hypothetical protein